MAPRKKILEPNLRIITRSTFIAYSNTIVSYHAKGYKFLSCMETDMDLVLDPNTIMDTDLDPDQKKYTTIFLDCLDTIQPGYGRYKKVNVYGKIHMKEKHQGFHFCSFLGHETQKPCPYNFLCSFI
jgi:hypothetical protein